MQNWNSYINRLDLPKTMYSFQNIYNLVGDSNATVVLRLKDMVIAIENQLFEDTKFKTQTTKNTIEDFFQLTHATRWDILLKNGAISFSVYKQAFELLKVLDRTTMPNASNLYAAITSLADVIEALIAKEPFEEQLLIMKEQGDIKLTTLEEKHSYNLFPSIENIPMPTKMNEATLENFWEVLIVHYELEIHKFSYELIKTMVRYNPDGALKNMKILFRALGQARLNYLAEEKSMEINDTFIDNQKFALVATEQLWETMYSIYGLSVSEYQEAKGILKLIKHDQVPKNILLAGFNSFEKLVTELFYAVKKQQSLGHIFDSQGVEEQQIENSKEIKQNSNQNESFKDHILSIKSEESRLSTKNEVLEESAATTLIAERGADMINIMRGDLTPEAIVSRVPKKQPIKFGSMFLQKIKGLQKSSNETVVNANELGDFQSYMHIERKIERDTIEMLKEMQSASSPQLLLLLGSVGDGKSHLLAYLKSTKPELFENVYIHNDATESHSRTRPAEETLERILAPFEDDQEPKQHIVIAINYGKLHNFYLMQEEKEKFKCFRSYIDSLNIFKNVKDSKGNLTFENFHTVDFSKEKYYSINEKGVYSVFFSSILDKIVAQNESNEIYKAWLLDKENNKWTIAHENYAFLMNELVRKRVVEKLIHVIIRNKLIVSTREFYNLIVDLIVPSEILLSPNSTAFSLNNSLPNLLFNHPERSAILFGFNELDPVFIKNNLNDELIASIFMHPNLETYLKDTIQIQNQFPFDSHWKNAIANNEYLEVARFVIRLKELLNEEDKNTDFSHFIRYLYAFFKGDGDVIEEVFTTLEKVVFQWKGSPKESYAYLTNNLKKGFRMAIPMDLDRTLDQEVFGSVEDGDIHAANHYITLGFNDINFELDLKLFEILRHVSNGRRPNLYEVGQAIQFEDFYNKIVKYFEDKEKKLLLVHVQTNSYYEISKPRFSKAKFDVKKV